MEGSGALENSGEFSGRSGNFPGVFCNFFKYFYEFLQTVSKITSGETHFLVRSTLLQKQVAELHESELFVEIHRVKLRVEHDFVTLVVFQHPVHEEAPVAHLPELLRDREPLQLENVASARADAATADRVLSRRVYEQVVATHARVVLVELVELCSEWEALFGDKNVFPELFFQIQRKSPGQHPDGFHWRGKYKIACPKTIHSDLLPSRLS